MRLLLDTHTFIWWDTAPSNLSEQVLAACRDRSNVLLLSVASVWEMQIKSQLGKLRLDLPVAEIIEAQRTTNHLEILPIYLEHVLGLQEISLHHRDPFDRLLIAQANVENAVLVSGDSVFGQYSVDLLW